MPAIQSSVRQFLSPKESYTKTIAIKMATKPSTQTFFHLVRPAKRRLTCKYIHRGHTRQPPASSSRRSINTATPHMSEMEVDGSPRPRWSHTPPAMAAPVRSRPRPEGVKPLRINEDPQVLDDIYVRFLGKDGDQLLQEETKWLAVTHKSFDHGRRGFNDRLSFLGVWTNLCLDACADTTPTGKRIVELQTTLGILASTTSSRYLKDTRDSHDRTPFVHPALEGVETLSGGARDHFTHHKHIAELAKQYRLQDVIRWVPVKACPPLPEPHTAMLTFSSSLKVLQPPGSTWSSHKPCTP